MGQTDRSEARWDAVGEALELLREGDTERALKELQKTLSEDPDNEYGHYYLGVAHFERGEFVQAMKAYLRAIELAPEYLGALLGLGHTLRMLGRYQGSIRVGRQVQQARCEASAQQLAHLTRAQHVAGLLDGFACNAPVGRTERDEQRLVFVLRHGERP